MKPLFYFIIFLNLLSVDSNAQVLLNSGKNETTLDFRTASFMQRRFDLDSGNVSRKKDGIFLRSFQTIFNGQQSDKFKYRFAFDFASLLTKPNDPSAPALLDASATYTGFSFCNIQFGYSKVPYSRQSQIAFFESIYWNRPEISNGILFSRRDVGITLSKKMLHKTINVYAGIYNGLGEYTLSSGNDPSGKPEFIGRVDYSYPSRYKYTEMDYSHVPLPMFSLGLNGRYANKSLPKGTSFATLTNGEFGSNVINGKKYTYGADFSFQYKGFSMQAEIHQIKAIFNDSLDANLQPYYPTNILPVSFTKNQMFAGGYFIQLNYYSQKINSAFSVRYEELNLNDLVNGKVNGFGNQIIIDGVKYSGNAARIGCAYAYRIKGNTMIKASYLYQLREEPIDMIGYRKQIRIGFQYVF